MGIGNTKRPAISGLDAIIVQDLRNSMVLTDGCIFSISKRFTVPASGVVDIIFNPTHANLQDKKLVFFPVFFQGFGAGPIEIDMYFGTDADENGTVIESFNRNHESINTRDVVVRLNPTINTIGTKLPPEFEIPSDGTPATAVLGGQTNETIITNLRKDGKYMFRLTNTEAVIARCVVAANWCEKE